MRGVRKNEIRGIKQAAAMKLSKLVEPVANTNKALRDKALLLIGFGGAFRRSELASLKMSDVQDTDYGSM